jgi:hypothetical protein
MPQLDAITPNPKQPKRLFGVKPKNPGVLPANEVARRRRLMWVIVAGAMVVIVVIWFGTLGSRLGKVEGDNSAWNTLKQKAADLVSIFHKGPDAKITNIDVNAPTDADIQYLREQVFPNSGAVTGDDADTARNQNVNLPVEGGSASDGNANQSTNANAR